MRHTKVRGFYWQVYFPCQTFDRIAHSFLALCTCYAVSSQLCGFFVRGFETETNPGVEQSYFVKTIRPGFR